MGRARRIVPGLVWAAAGVVSAGCGGGSAGVQPPPPPQDFSLTASPASVTIAQGETSAPISIGIAVQNGFSGSVQVTLSGLPSGVTSTPASPLTVNAGASQQVVFGASANAATGTATITAQGTSGTLSHSAALSLTVRASPPPPPLPRTTYARTESLLALDDPGGEPRRKRIAYDAARKLIFAANPGMNRLEVLSSLDGSRAGEIAIPAVTSADISADGSVVWAGTADEQIAAVDPVQMVVTARYPVSGVAGPLNTVFNRPVEVVALAGGKNLVRLRRPDAATSLLALWDPPTNSFTDLTNKAPAVFQNGAGVIARSGDHLRLLAAANDSSGYVALFDAAGNLLAGPAVVGSGAILLAAANSDGSLFAVVLQGGNGTAIITLEGRRTLNPLHAHGVTAAHGLAFSRDGTVLYVSENADLPPAVTALDAATLLVIGQVSDVRIGGARTEIEEADETGMLFGISNRGVSLVDASQPGTLPASVPTFAPAPAVAPSEGPAAGGTFALIVGQDFPSTAIVRFGGALAPNVNVPSATQIQASSPPSAGAGAQNVAAYFPGGWIALAPSGFSYGPQVLEILPNAGQKNGSDVVQILGYGFGSDPAKVNVTFGGANAPVSKVEDVTSQTASLALPSGYPFPLERITVQTPAGTPGKADVVVNSPAGSTTVSGAFQYLQSVQVFGKAGLFKFILYDPNRRRVYLTNTDRVDVFDLAAGQFAADLLPPGGPPPSAGLRGMALTPDASQSKLVVADFGAQNVYLLDPDTSNPGEPSSGTTVFVGGVPGFQNSGPARVAATSTGQVFVGLVGEGSGGCSACLGQLDIATQTIQVAPQPELTSLTGAPLLSGTTSGEQVYLAFGTAPGGPVAVWDAASNHFSSSGGNTPTDDLGVAGDGASFIARQGGKTQVRGRDLTLAAVPTQSELEAIQGEISVPGFTLHPTGALIYRPFLIAGSGVIPALGAVDILDAHTGVLRLRVMLPEALMTDVDGLHGGFLATDETGARLFAITASGLTVVQLARVPLAVGSVSPATGAAAGGTQITIRGSGFQSGTTVTIGGASAAAHFVDADTLEVTTPVMKPGPQRITAKNSDGETYALDAAFTAN